MTTARKIYLFGAVVMLGGAFCALKPSEQMPVAGHSRTVSEAIPSIAVAKSDGQKITKIELSRPDEDDKSRIRTTTLEKLGQEWAITFPLRTRASTSKVEELISNLENLHLWEVVDRGTGYYDQYDLTDAKALHVIAWKGAQKASEFYCGKSSARGQLVRVPNKDGIFALVNWGQEGYAGFLYTRELRSWREISILKFEEDAAVRVEIENRNGVFLFSKPGGEWTGSFAKRRGDGKLSKPEQAWKDFDESKVRDLVRAFSTLAADDFGEDKDKVDAGVDAAERVGGVVRIRLQNQASAKPSDLTLRVGKPSKGTTRWSIKDSRWAIKEGGDGTLYALSPWTAGWATADAHKFDKEKGK